MPRLFPGMLYAILAGIPGIWVAVWLSSPRIREKAFGELLSTFASATPIILPMYAIPALIYGSIAWLCLRATGLLNLAMLVVAGILPVLAYWAWSVVKQGWEPRAFWALGAFTVPALFISVALWWFTVHGRSGF